MLARLRARGDVRALRVLRDAARVTGCGCNCRHRGRGEGVRQGAVLACASAGIICLLACLLTCLLACLLLRLLAGLRA
jgi:hypothetical protein